MTVPPYANEPSALLLVEVGIAALDDLHVAIWDQYLPKEFDWMADRVCGVMYKGQQMDASVFPGPQAVRSPGVRQLAADKGA